MGKRLSAPEREVTAPALDFLTLTPYGRPVVMTTGPFVYGTAAEVAAVRTRRAIPLYHEIEVELRKLILSGELAAGSLLPTEPQLQASFGVSRATVRKAIEELVLAGLIIKRQGVGTFVAEPGATNFKCLASFTLEAIRDGRKPGTEIIAVEVGPGKEPGAARLELADDENVLFVKRLRLLDGEPAFVASAYLPERLVPGLDPRALERDGPEQSLYRLVESRYGVSLCEGEEVTSAVEADAEIAKIFGLEPGTPVVKEACLLRNRTGAAVIYEEAVWGLPQSSRIRWKTVAPPGTPA
jgi:GntR family transcriptional regulator